MTEPWGTPHALLLFLDVKQRVMFLKLFLVLLYISIFRLIV